MLVNLYLNQREESMKANSVVSRGQFAGSVRAAGPARWGLLEQFSEKLS